MSTKAPQGPAYNKLEPRVTKLEVQLSEMASNISRLAETIEKQENIQEKRDDAIHEKLDRIDQKNMEKGKTNWQTIVAFATFVITCSVMIINMIVLPIKTEQTHIRNDIQSESRLIHKEMELNEKYFNFRLENVEKQVNNQPKSP